MDYEKYELTISEADKKRSDGCTLAPDGSWGSCCVIHDTALRDKDVSASQADKMLFRCMKKRSNIVMATLYYTFVRIRSILGLDPVALMMLMFMGSLIGAAMYWG